MVPIGMCTQVCWIGDEGSQLGHQLLSHVRTTGGCLPTGEMASVCSVCLPGQKPVVMSKSDRDE